MRKYSKYIQKTNFKKREKNQKIRGFKIRGLKANLQKITQNKGKEITEEKIYKKMVLEMKALVPRPKKRPSTQHYE